MKCANLSRRLCEEDSKYVDKGMGQCKECPHVMLPVLIFLAYAGGTGLSLFLLYVLLCRSWWVFKLSARAVRWVTMVHAHSFGQQGPAKFKVFPATFACALDVSVSRHQWRSTQPPPPVA